MISPEAALIRRCLRGFIDDYIVSVLQQDAELPELPERLLEDLLVPLPPGTWHELRLQTRRRFWILDIVQEGREAPPVRWVSEGEKGLWRDGWSW